MKANGSVSKATGFWVRTHWAGVVGLFSLCKKYLCTALQQTQNARESGDAVKLFIRELCFYRGVPNACKSITKTLVLYVSNTASIYTAFSVPLASTEENAE